MDPNVPGSSNPQPGSNDPFRRNPDGTLPDDWPGAKPAPGATQPPPAHEAPSAPVTETPTPAPDTHHPS